MADAKLTALTAASALAGADLYYISQGGVSKKATHTQLLTLVGTTYVPLAGGTMTGALTIGSGTITASAPALSVTQTWNSGATVFTALKVNVTNTASNDNSMLCDLQLAGTSKFNVSRDGVVTTTNTISLQNILCSGSLYIPSDAAIRWSSTTSVNVANDVLLCRDAAATLAQRNGTTQQISRIYNTYTDSSNYERLTLTGVAGTSVNITAETLGTGADNLNLVLGAAGASGLISFKIDGSQYHLMGAGYFLQSGYHQLAEMTAPAAGATNTVRIYAEDNGSGKTRLMALFATGSAVQIAIEP